MFVVVQFLQHSVFCLCVSSAASSCWLRQQSTSSDPISNSTSGVPEVAPVTDIVSDAENTALALESIDTLLDLSRKRDGSVMSEAGVTSSTSPAIAPLPPDGWALMDVDGVKVPLDEVDDQTLKDPLGKKQKNGNEIADLVEAAADKAMAKAMQRMMSENSRLHESVASAVTNAVNKLSTDLHREFNQWETKMDEKVKIQLMNHESEFEKKWGNKTTQLEPNSLEGVISNAEFRIRKNSRRRWIGTGRNGWRRRTRL